MIRAQKVIIDADLAEIHGVPTRALNQAVKRNIKRFPEDFMFRLDKNEVAELNRSQFVTSSQKHRDPRFPPYAFTEHGAIMVASVLNSPRAITVSVHVVRAYVKVREFLATHKVIEDITLLKSLVAIHGTDIEKIKQVLHRLIEEPEKPKRRIGFRPHGNKTT